MWCFPQVIQAQTPLKVQHVVQKGETLYKISKDYEMTVSELRTLNPGVSVLKPGMKLNVMKKITVQSRKNAPLNHTVEKGETLYAISKKYQVKVSEIRELNEMTDNAINAGQILKIPNNGTLEVEETAKVESSQNVLKDAQQKKVELAQTVLTDKDLNEIKGGIIEQRASSNKTVFVTKSATKTISLVDTTANRVDAKQAFIWIADVPAQQVVCIINPKTEKMAYALSQPKQKGQSTNQAFVTPLIADKLGLSGSAELTIQYVVPKS